MPDGKRYEDLTVEEIQDALQAPTPPERIEYLGKNARKTDSGVWVAKALPYHDARFTQERLDEVVGVFNWRSDVQAIGGLLMVGIGIRHPNRADEWIWRWDTGQDEPIDEDSDSEISGGRGIFSKSFKRAGYQWGIGRDTYAMAKPWRQCATRESRGRMFFAGWIPNEGEITGTWLPQEGGRKPRQPGKQQNATHEARKAALAPKEEDQPAGKPEDKAKSKAKPPDSNAFFALAFGTELKLDRDTALATAKQFTKEGKTDWAAAIDALKKQLPPPMAKE